MDIFTIIIISISGFLVIAIVGFFLRAVIFPKRIEQVARLVEQGYTQAAIKTLKSLIEKNERNVEAHYWLAEAYYKEKKLEQALIEYKQIIKIGKFTGLITEEKIRTRLANIYLDFGQIEEAQKEFILISKINPTNYEALFEIGKLFYDRGLRDNAVAYLKKALSVNARHAMSNFYLGRIFYEVGNFPDALETLQTAVKVDQKLYAAHYYLGLVYLHSKNYVNAINEFQIAARDDEYKLKSSLQIGKCYLEMNDYNKAQVELERALKYVKEENNTTAALRYTLATVYEKQRDLPNAIEQWEKIAVFKPDYQDVVQKLAMYQDLRADDRLKDFLTASDAKFEEICKKLIAYMGLDIVNYEVHKGASFECVAQEPETKWRNTKKTTKIVKIFRDGKPVQEITLRVMIDEMKRYAARRAICITTANFSASALRYAQNRPIDLIDKSGLTKLLREMEKASGRQKS